MIERLTHSRGIQNCTKNIEIEKHNKPCPIPYSCPCHFIRLPDMYLHSFYMPRVCIHVCPCAQICCFFSFTSTIWSQRKNKEFHPTTNKRRTKKAPRFMPAKDPYITPKISNYHSFKNRCKDALPFEPQPLITYYLFFLIPTWSKRIRKKTCFL